MELKTYERWKANRPFDYVDHRSNFNRVMKAPPKDQDNILQMYKNKW